MDFKKILFYLKRTGRVNRPELLFLTLILSLCEAFAWLVFDHGSKAFIIISLAISIVYLIQCAKRYHDLNLWGINGYVWFILPIANLFYLYQIYFKKGTDGVNKYGEPSSFTFSSLKNRIYKQDGSKALVSAESEIETVNEYSEINGIVEFRLYYSKIQIDPQLKSIDKTSIYKWIKKDGDWVNEGKPICIILCTDDSIKINKSIVLVTARSGFLELCFQEKEELKEGATIYKLHPLGSYVKENSAAKESFYLYFDCYLYFDLSTVPFVHNTNIKEWLKHDGEFVNQGDLIFKICKNSYSTDNEVYNHYAEKSGFLDIANYSKLNPFQGFLVYAINEKDNKRINDKFFNRSLIKLDDFTNKKTIKWYWVGGELKSGIATHSQNILTGFTFAFNNIEDKDYIVFQFHSKEIMLTKGDVVSFLFTDNRIIDFPITNVSYKTSNQANQKLFENKVQIAVDELNQFQNIDFAKWKIISKKESREIIGGEKGFGQYLSHNNLITVIQKFTREYRELVTAEIAEYKPLIERELLSSVAQMPVSEECHVYLMIDTINRYHKIGISNKPYWREKTLQSEKPTIELIASKRFINRKIASSFEKALHDTYSSKRIRGEWFQLDYVEVEEIKITLDN